MSALRISGRAIGRCIKNRNEHTSCFETNKQLCTQYYLYAQANSTIHTDSAVVGLYHGPAESGEEVFEAK
jgi:hypothetical protein